MVSALCFGYFRAGIVYQHLGKTEAILAGRFLTMTKQDQLLDFFHPEWAAIMEKSLQEKLAQLTPIWSEEDFLKKLFPLHEAMSQGMDFISFGRSFLQQPPLFVRLRPGKEEKVLQILASSGISYRELPPAAVELPPATVMDKRMMIDQDVVIQDLSSQRVASLFPAFGELRGPEIWDCCAGSGGKSLLAADFYPGMKLTVSDNRESILRNLDKRFQAAGIQSYRKAVIDLSDAQWKGNTSFTPAGKGFDLVIADVPCSGSGTWARSPEQITRVTFGDLNAFVERQQAIIRSVLPFIKPGGYFLYLTCSAFACENEGQVEWINAAGPLQLIEQRLYTGYQEGADTMFGALFRVL
jgi:16S rRNA (cytosine967-C5)-methyltransferase